MISLGIFSRQVHKISQGKESTSSKVCSRIWQCESTQEGSYLCLESLILSIELFCDLPALFRERCISTKEANDFRALDRCCRMDELQEVGILPSHFYVVNQMDRNLTWFLNSIEVRKRGDTGRIGQGDSKKSSWPNRAGIRTTG